MIMNGAIKRRLLSLERSAEIKHAASMAQIQYDVFEAIHLSEEDHKLLDAILERGEPSTVEEQGALDRYSAEYERAFKLISSRCREQSRRVN
jgi:hypothetical protein